MFKKKRLESDWHFGRCVLEAWQRWKILPPCVCMCECVFLLYVTLSRLVQYMQTSVFACATLACLVFARDYVHHIPHSVTCLCLFFLLLSVWEWENIHIAHLGLAWSQQSCLTEKLPVVSLAVPNRQIWLYHFLLSPPTPPLSTPLLSPARSALFLSSQHSSLSLFLPFLYLISRGVWN